MNFIDTNILLYAFGKSVDGDSRSDIARQVIANGDLAFSIQVFQEFFVQATHSRRVDPLSRGEAAKVIEALRKFPIQVNDLRIFQIALGLQDRYQVSFWDANIIAAANQLHCKTLYSEDLNHGQTYGQCHVINPFSA